MADTNMSANRTLRGDVIVKTIDQLRTRIEERFGERGLTRAAVDLTTIGQRTLRRAAKLRRAYWGLRIGALVFILLTFAVVLSVVTDYRVTHRGEASSLELFQGVEGMLNILFLSSLYVLFVFGVESRLKRARALAGLHELRSIAHVIDMHQLTKDPMRLDLAPTKHSPVRDLSPDEMVRYLIYCSEMLSLTAKLAALYAERLRDSAVVDAVNDVEELTTGLGRKMWQKVTIIRDEQRERPVNRVEV